MKTGKLLLYVVIFLFAKNIYSQCTASFSYTVECLQVDFTDNSSAPESINSWNWSFNGGNPTTAFVQNPQDIIFPGPGSYQVDLEITTPTCTDDTSILIVIPYPFGFAQGRL